MMKLERAQMVIVEWSDKTAVHLIAVHDWILAKGAETPMGIGRLQRPVYEMIDYLFANDDSPPNYGEGYRSGQPVSSAWVESAVNEIVSKRMAKKRQMRWNRDTVQPFSHGQNIRAQRDTRRCFRHWHPIFGSPKSVPLQSAAA